MAVKIPERYFPREGDVVTVNAKVRFNFDVGDTSVHLTIDGFQRVTAPLADVVSWVSREWKPGDQIGWNDGPGVVVAIVEDRVWVRSNTTLRDEIVRLDEIWPPVPPSDETMDAPPDDPIF